MSVAGALSDYGVRRDPVGRRLRRRTSTATAAARAAMAAGDPSASPFFDRGPGYARLSGGRAFAEVDFR